MTPKRVALVLIALFGSNGAHAGELTVPNDFVAGTPAVAAEVNANFTAAEQAVNDNANRVVQLENAMTSLTARVDALETAMAGFHVSAQTYYGSDLIFLKNDATGTLSAFAPGGSAAYLMVPTNYEYYAIPTLDTISFQVDKDNTTVIFYVTGQAYITTFNALSKLDVALRVDGAVPVKGATEFLWMVSDDTISSGGQSWTIQYPVQLNAGTHTFSVLVKASSVNESSITIDGRTDGRVKVNILQLKGAN